MCVPQRTADTAHEKKAQDLLENTSNGSVLRLSAWQGGIRLLEIVHSIAYLALWPPENLNFFHNKIQNPWNINTHIQLSWTGKESLRSVVSTSLEILPTNLSDIAGDLLVRT